MFSETRKYSNKDKRKSSYIIMFINDHIYSDNITKIKRYDTDAGNIAVVNSFWRPKVLIHRKST